MRTLDLRHPQVVCDTVFNALMFGDSDLTSESKWALNVKLRSKMKTRINTRNFFSKDHINDYLNIFVDYVIALS